ncbi:MAG: DUF1844 domain-containing protein [Candidatus Omnitrophica bacterium]|nr:DUF1844 domain-containing protein [Candidatus Omnitrophota bacterium]
MENFEEKKKKVDEAWKEAVDKEKTGGETPSPGQEEYPQEINFGLFLSSLMIEGLIALGEVENPVTKKKEINLGQARYVIDVISMLQGKTKNNLTPDEKNAVEQVLYELRMRYVGKTK